MHTLVATLAYGSRRAATCGPGDGRRRWRPTEKPHERRAKPAADSGMSERVEGQVKHAMFMLCGCACQYFIDSDAYNARLRVVRQRWYTWGETVRRNRAKAGVIDLAALRAMVSVAARLGSGQK